MTAASTNVQPTDTLWSSVEHGLERLCRAWTSGQLVPLLEADFAGYLYHLLVGDCSGDARFVHLDTRLATSKSRAKFDLVVGPVLSTENQKSSVLEGIAELPHETQRFVASKASLALFRPAVLPKIILEFKAFPLGFTAQQRGVHFKEALEDLSKLKGVAETCPNGRGVVMFDGDGYLEKRLHGLLQKRGGEDSRIRVYVCGCPSAANACWNLH